MATALRSRPPRWQPERTWRYLAGNAAYLAAAGYAGVLITPAPFFWAPPVWVLALLMPAADTRPCASRAGYKSAKLAGGAITRGRARHVSD